MNKNKADVVKRSIGRFYNDGQLDGDDLRHIAAYCLEKAADGEEVQG